MDLNAVRLLVRVAETRSFTRAAGDLGLTQSGLSRAISRLENQLGVRLLQRNTRSVSLTPDGQMLYERSAPLLAELAEAERQMLDRRASPSGLLKISTPSLFGSKVVMPVIGELTLQYPDLRIEAVMTDRLVDIVDEGFDALLRTGDIQDQRLIARALPPLRWVTVAAPAYLARFGTPQTVDELQDHNCLTVRNLRTSRLVDWQFMLDGRVQDVSVEGRLIFDIGDALVDGALGGFGIAQVMDFAVREDLAAGRLVPLLEEFAGRSRAISLVYPPSRQYSPKLMAFAEALSKAQW
ncbi:MAG: LysR family transcriptional regulator [Pseudomonas sp.]|uniref:LysR family transcriptional regulator n=1 Tax=Pseudomonas sp. TaxID=306 RepID=UPI00238891E9|nr:LysR family transcriptional regulator [Pseudomonas sp.]MDP9030872.1 LysR family transcriptional regulator [Pseudomonadota bacterium]MDE1908044.1 LysR family transcriptional regulator [Pseudomonas sp.]MDE2032428.1 LysR family transcriptional regulator [Pseudomonas sp.]MDE2189784.1 LysR family transcriptional regulator [Pseudomonas sp.]MDE2556061.1 LysR family transcriptional regulator [Pseudomonas sp.]